MSAEVCRFTVVDALRSGVTGAFGRFWYHSVLLLTVACAAGVAVLTANQVRPLFASLAGAISLSAALLGAVAVGALTVSSLRPAEMSIPALLSDGFALSVRSLIVCAAGATLVLLRLLVPLCFVPLSTALAQLFTYGWIFGAVVATFAAVVLCETLGRYGFAPFIIADTGAGAFRALVRSNRLSAGHRVRLSLLYAAILTLNALGALALGIGLLFTIPASALALAHAYRRIQQERTVFGER